MSVRHSIAVLATLGALHAPAWGYAGAQQATNLPPIRELTRRVAEAADTFGNVSGVRQLSDGRVIVNDAGKRRLVVLDSTLRHATVIADSTESTRKAYGAAPGGIIAGHGDTTFFVDPLALALLVIHPEGTLAPEGAFARPVAPPRPADAAALSMPIGNAGVDGAGRLVYRNVRAFCRPAGCGFGIGGTSLDTVVLRQSGLPKWAMHDSVAIIRGAIGTQRIDTAGFVAIPFVGDMRDTRNPDGSVTFTEEMPIPIPLADGWGVLNDGSVAFVRGLDYHIDWVNADGTRSSTPKMAHDWRRLSDSEKTWILDSAKHAADSMMALSAARQAKQDSIDHTPVSQHTHEVLAWPDPTDFPDYRPPLTQYATVKGDADGNLWIQQGGTPSSTLGPGSPLLFDVVNRRGVLIDRVQLPPTLSLAGFGPGVVYLTSREGSGTVLLKYRIR